MKKIAAILLSIAFMGVCTSCISSKADEITELQKNTLFIDDVVFVIPQNYDFSNMSTTLTNDEINAYSMSGMEAYSTVGGAFKKLEVHSKTIEFPEGAKQKKLDISYCDYKGKVILYPPVGSDYSYQHCQSNLGKGMFYIWFENSIKNQAYKVNVIDGSVSPVFDQTGFEEFLKLSVKRDDPNAVYYEAKVWAFIKGVSPDGSKIIFQTNRKTYGTSTWEFWVKDVYTGKEQYLLPQDSYSEVQWMDNNTFLYDNRTQEKYSFSLDTKTSKLLMKNDSETDQAKNNNVVYQTKLLEVFSDTFSIKDIYQNKRFQFDNKSLSEDAQKALKSFICEFKTSSKNTYSFIQAQYQKNNAAIDEYIVTDNNNAKAYALDHTQFSIHPANWTSDDNLVIVCHKGMIAYTKIIKISDLKIGVE